MIAAVIGVAVSVVINLVLLSFYAGRRDRDVAKDHADVNGLGKKYARMLAFYLRCIAEEIEAEKAIAKAKLMHLADLIEPK